MMERSALISDCGTYRYWLRRVWDVAKPEVCFIMLNPSTADSSVDDATVRKCISFGKTWGMGAIRVVNLFALRSTDPKELERAIYPVGPDNDYHVRCAAAMAFAAGGKIVAAWGAHGGLKSRNFDVKANLRDAGLRDVQCLGLTGKGHPKHPLYVKLVTPLVPFKL